MEADRQWERKVRHLMKMPCNGFLLARVVSDYRIGEGKKARQLLTLFIKNRGAQTLHYLIIGQGVVEKMGLLRANEAIYVNVTSDAGDKKVAVVTVFSFNKKRKMINLVSNTKFGYDCLDDLSNYYDSKCDYHNHHDGDRLPSRWTTNNADSDLDDSLDDIATCSVERCAKAPRADAPVGKVRVGYGSKEKGPLRSALRGIVHQMKTEIIRIRDNIKSKEKTANKSRSSKISIIKLCAIFIREMFRKG